MKERDDDSSRRARQPEKGRKAQKVRNLIKVINVGEYDEDGFEELGSFTKIPTSRKT